MVATIEKNEKNEKAERVERGERAEKAERPERADRGPRPEREPAMSRDVAEGRAPNREEQAMRARAIENALGQIQKKYGAGSIMRLGSGYKPDVRVISSGSLALDFALGCGGFPRGRVVEIFGPESSGKTTLALHVIANAQRSGGVAAFIDAEHALDPTYARRLGVSLESLLISQPDCGEQALEIAEMLVTSSGVDVVVIDSVAALVPRAELEGEMGDQHVGLQARLMSQALRRLTAVINRSQTCVIFINQIREKVGVMFGSPETTSGGRALKFYSSVRIDIRRISSLKEGDDSVGNRTRAKVVKNKLAPPFRKAEFDILFNRGISWEGDVVDLAAEHGVIEKSGSWYNFGDVKLGQGRDKVVEFLEQRRGQQPRLEIEAQLVARLFPPPEAPAVAPASGPLALPAVGGPERKAERREKEKG
jgi:recombination protein RecA